MTIEKKGQTTDQMRAFGESGEGTPVQFARTFSVENAMLFGRAAMKGTAGNQVKAFAGAGGVFKGLVARATDATDAATDGYAAGDLAGIAESGNLVVFVEEDVVRGDAVRIRHTAKTATAGTGTLSSAPLTFVGATVPAVATNSYDLDIAIDGSDWYQLTIAVVVTQDWDTIAATIQTALRAATSSTETVAISGGKVLVSSVTTGLTSDVRIRPGTAGNAGGDLIIAITDQVTSMTVTIDVPVDGTAFPASGFAKTADAGKTVLLTGAEWIQDSKVVDLTESIRAAVLKVDGPFTTTADT